jgi:hypothetical protein
MGRSTEVLPNKKKYFSRIFETCYPFKIIFNLEKIRQFEIKIIFQKVSKTRDDTGRQNKTFFVQVEYAKTM